MDNNLSCHNLKLVVVCPRFQFWSAIIFCVLLWISIYKIRLDLPIGDTISDSLIFLVAFVGAPLGVFLALWKLRIEGDIVYASKFLGLLNSTYTFQEFLKSKVIVIKEGTKYESIKIIFHDGLTFRINPLCTGYTRLKEIIKHLKLV